MKTYRPSASGRRITLSLLVGALIIWGFALWSLSSTLSLSYHPAQLWPTLNAALSQGLSIGELIPSLLMVVLIIATPLLIWNLIEEWGAAYMPTAQGLRFTAPLVELVVPWSAVRSLHALDDDQDERFDLLHLTDDLGSQIRNPIARLLHRQAHGRARLLIYPGIAERDALIADIRRLSGPQATPEPVGAVS